MVSRSLLLTVGLFVAAFAQAKAFASILPGCHGKILHRSVGCLNLSENSADADDASSASFGSSSLDMASAKSISKESSQLHEALLSRQKELNKGVGKRYVARTQQGFLNVHHEPSDPFDTHNIVSTLKEGQVVMSIAPPRGSWIHHDAGGWSIAQHAGFTWLEVIEE